MSAEEAAGAGEWVRHAIPELGLAFDVRRDWPLDSFALPDGVVVSQRLPGEAGAFWLRYGPGQTLEALLATLGGGQAAGALAEAESVTVAGQPARRVTATLREPGGGSFRGDGHPRDRAPVIVTHLVVLGLTLRDTPVILGYRVYADARAQYEPALARMLASIRIGGA